MLVGVRENALVCEFVCSARPASVLNSINFTLRFNKFYYVLSFYIVIYAVYITNMHRIKESLGAPSVNGGRWLKYIHITLNLRIIQMKRFFEILVCDEITYNKIIIKQVLTLFHIHRSLVTFYTQ